MAKVRDIDERVTVTVFCCEHCHGDPHDCPDAKTVERDAAMARNCAEALSLLERASDLWVGGGNARHSLMRAYLHMDIEQFLRRVGRAMAG